MAADRRTERPSRVRTATIQHAFAVLADERPITRRHGRTAVVAGEAEPNGSNRRARRPARSHDCKLAGCRPHVCKSMLAEATRDPLVLVPPHLDNPSARQ